MSMIDQFNRLVSSLRNKIFLLLGRGVVKALKTDQGTQLIQVVGLDGETISDIERMEEYGFTASPSTDSEAVIGFLNGNREQGLVLCINDRRYRPKDLKSGEVCVYDKNGSKILLDENGNIKVTSTKDISMEDANGNTIGMSSSGVSIEDSFGSKVELDGSGQATVTSTLGLTLASGDAVGFLPNVLPVDPLTGLPHGGPGAGIVFLGGA